MLIRAHARGIVQLSLRPVPVIARPISSVVPFRHVRHATSKTAAAPPQKQTEQHGRLPSQQQQEQKNKEGFTSLSSSQKSWLTQKIETSPAAKKMFFGITNLLGYGSPKQVAGQRSFAMYEQICAVRPDQERLFWQKECLLPPTFQSWFTITNLHIWLLTVRLRALPPPHGKAYIQGLIDHFFFDVEDRIRAVLQPLSTPTTPYTFETSFYSRPNTFLAATEGSSNTPAAAQPQKLTRAPDRLVTQQMKIFKEQWAGMGLSLDVGLTQGDMEMAGAMWRNILGARGARGIALVDDSRTFHRAVNLVGGEVINVAKINLEKEEFEDDGSGVHDFPPEESEKYLAYPELMHDLVAYLRRELVRLESISDGEILQGDLQKLAFGKVRF